MKRKHNGRWIVVQNHELDVPILEVLAERGTAHVGVIRAELEKKCVFGKYMMGPHKNNHFRWQYLVNVRLYWLLEQMCVSRGTAPAVWTKKEGVMEGPPPLKKFGPGGQDYIDEYMLILDEPSEEEVSWADREDEVAQATVAQAPVAQAVEVEASVPEETSPLEDRIGADWEDEIDSVADDILKDPEDVEAKLNEWAGGDVKKERRVYVTNYAGHNYTKAESYGELRFVTQGYVNFKDRDRLVYDLATKIADSRPDDYLLLSGHLIVNIVCFQLWMTKHNRCRILSWSNRWSKYETDEYEVPHMEQVIEITGGFNAGGE